MKTRLSIQDILQKKGQEKIICLTAYSFPMAKILDDFCDIILVGDSVGMTIYGMKDTVDVTLQMMIDHGRAVVNATKKSLIVVDLPHGTYEESFEQALISAQETIEKTNCDAVKIEVSYDLIPTLKYLVDHGVNVVGHVGLLPQSVRKIGGYKYQGRDENSAAEILAASKAIEKAGAFALVIEAVPAVLAEAITNSINIPTIGIGASQKCDGQVLVIDDLLGLNQEFKPRFVEYYTDLKAVISSAVKQFSDDVKSEQFPGKKNLV
jgi:3-methyl-2-oxobutanoate hydroxymethyltransferase